MIEIKLNSFTSLIAKISDEDYLRVSKYNWIIHRGRKVYARAKINGKYISLHNFILETEQEIDHLNGDGLDCQRDNIRIATHSQNLANRIKYKEGTTEYKGVYFNKQRNKFQAQIMVHKKQLYLGRFSNAKDAALAYNEAALKYFGEFAILNEI